MNTKDALNLEQWHLALPRTFFGLARLRGLVLVYIRDLDVVYWLTLGLLVRQGLLRCLGCFVHRQRRVATH